MIVHRVYEYVSNSRVRLEEMQVDISGGPELQEHPVSPWYPG